MFILDIYIVITFEPFVVQLVSCICVWEWMFDITTQRLPVEMYGDNREKERKKPQRIEFNT